MCPALTADDLRSWFSKAREHYLSANYREALRLDEKLRDEALAASIHEWVVLGHRYVGLCHYRLDELTESETSLRAALDLARELEWTRQELLITNHLGATLRRQGKYLDARDVFTAALKRATLPDFLAERCRLLGNYGAFLDELGQRARADDCYSRFEELAELLGTPDRLANARGLAARSAKLRHDTEIALEKYNDEARLARESNNQLRVLGAKIHAAGLLPPRESVDALSSLLNSHEIAISSSRTIDAHLTLAEKHLDHPSVEGCSIRLAWHHACLALQLTGPRGDATDSHWEKRAQAHTLLARSATKAGLHGEAHHYLKLAIDERHDMYKSLRSSAELRSMAQERLNSLTELTEELIDEALMVVRTDAEKQELQTLVEKVRGETIQGGLNGLYKERHARRRSGESLWTWAAKQRRSASERWELLMGSDLFNKLSQESREDLIQSDISYSAGVNDLARSAHLLATVVERELIARLHSSFSVPGGRISFGHLLNEIDAVATGGSARRGLRAHLRRLGSKVRCLKDLNHPVVDVEGNSVRLIEVRNEVAHGAERQPSSAFSRLTVDAIKRLLAVEPRAPNGLSLLQHIAQL